MDQLDTFGSVLPTFFAVFLNGMGMVSLVGLAVSGLIIGLLSLTAFLLRIGLVGKWAGRKLVGTRNSRVKSGYQRSGFGYLIQGIVGNPVMPLVMIGVVFVFVGTTLIYFVNNNKGIEFFVDTEPEQAMITIVRDNVVRDGGQLL